MDVFCPSTSSSNQVLDDDDQLPCGSSITDELQLNDFGLDTIPLRYLVAHSNYHPYRITQLDLSHNSFLHIKGLSTFSNLTSLDVSNNHLASLPDEIGELTCLRSLISRNNLLETLPKTMTEMNRMESIYLSGNRMEIVPNVILTMRSLKVLHLGANRLESLPVMIGNLMNLEILYLGGNRLCEVPASIGRLVNLTSLGLCDNQLETLPHSLGDLHQLESLSLHNNCIRTLPTEIIKLQNLQQLSLRNNPLVHQFVHNLEIEPPTLKEISGRVVKKRLGRVQLQMLLPRELTEYLQSASHCVNPKCKGVYFDARVEHVKFVDFCGKYRVPLLQFLCSPRCSTSTPAVVTSDSDSDEEINPRMQRVLLG